MNKFKVLIFPCGAENALEINEALKTNVLIEVIGASSVKDHGVFAFENYVGDIPNIVEKNFIEEFNKVIINKEVDFIIPTHDTIALYLAENRSKIKAKVICSAYQTALICREKRKTFELFKDEPFIPEAIDPECKNIGFPVFVKPNVGEGAKNTAILNNHEELNFWLGRKIDLLVQEYLPGIELTIDCFTDRKGQLRFVGPRTRERIRMGISFHSENYPLTQDIEIIAHTINEKLDLRGLWFFQIRQDKFGVFKLLEISTRCAGTMSLYRQLGVNFPLLSVFDFADLDVDIIVNDNHIELDRCLLTRYKQSIEFKTVFIDFDDTIIVKGKVNLQALKFVYQCVEYMKKVVLITRHEKDLYSTLDEKRISKTLFDEIIHLKVDECKADFIIGKKDAIFLDNAFKERKVVKEKCGIPVFDVDAIQSLIVF